MIILATARPQELEPFRTALAQESGQEVKTSPTGQEALDLFKDGPVALVVVDENLPDFTPLKLVLQVVMTSAMTNTAVVTSMSEEDFHEASEGYGVLCPLPVQPGRDDGLKLARLLAKM